MSDFLIGVQIGWAVTFGLVCGLTILVGAVVLVYVSNVKSDE